MVVKQPGNGIGSRLRLRRTIKGLTLREAAEQAGISFGQLSQIERGVSSPSVSILVKICEALQMPVSWLFEDRATSPSEEEVIVRKTDRRTLTFEAMKMEKVLLTPDHCTDVQMMEITIHPGGGLSPQAATQDRAKCGTVIEGCLAMEIKGNRYELFAGDTFAVNRNIPHTYWCKDDQSVKILFVITPALY